LAWQRYGTRSVSPHLLQRRQVPAWPFPAGGVKGAYAKVASSKISAEIKDGPNQLAPFDLN
jgi:hypothetical protein